MWRADSFEKTLMLGKIKGGRKGDDRGWDGQMASPTQWTWVWVNSRSWWWTGRPGVLRFMGSQRVGHDWVTELNWTDSLVVRAGGLRDRSGYLSHLLSRSQRCETSYKVQDKPPRWRIIGSKMSVVLRVRSPDHKVILNLNPAPVVVPAFPVTVRNRTTSSHSVLPYGINPQIHRKCISDMLSHLFAEKTSLCTEIGFV